MLSASLLAPGRNQHLCSLALFFCSSERHLRTTCSLMLLTAQKMSSWDSGITPMGPPDNAQLFALAHCLIQCHWSPSRSQSLQVILHEELLPVYTVPEGGKAIFLSYIYWGHWAPDLRFLMPSSTSFCHSFLCRISTDKTCTWSISSPAPASPRKKKISS